jgi:NAD(P)H-dependent FMN reductase
MAEQPVLQVFLTSTRPGRACKPIGDWFFDAAGRHGKFAVEQIDLKQIDLPMMNEPDHPRLRAYTQKSTKEWSAVVERADAFVFVTPEYNHGFTAPLKNAIDHLVHEWAYKPVGFVSYGGVSGGMRSVQTAKLMVTGFKMMPMVEAVNIPFYTQLMENGVFKSNELHDKAVPVMLDELLRWSEALKSLRQ